MIPVQANTAPVTGLPIPELRDIHLPAAIDWWPLAWGWWALITLSIFTLIAVVILIIRYRKKMAYRRQALALLKQTHLEFNQTNDQQYYVTQVERILKRVAIYAYPQQAPSLNGEKWLSFLDQTMKPTKDSGHKFNSELGQVFLQALYSNKIGETLFDVKHFTALAIHWIKTHRSTLSTTINTQFSSIDSQTGEKNAHV